MDSICYLADGMVDVNRLTSFVQADLLQLQLVLLYRPAALLSIRNKLVPQVCSRTLQAKHYFDGRRLRVRTK